ncbi:MAG: response regulator transcription factor [Phycisphaerales bacterium]|nr:response regulator transcription factor [Phycisphaerales bacterium]
MKLESSKGNILIVEDEENIAALLQLNLELESYEVSIAKTGFQAVKMAKAEYFDLVILDIMLPEMDGIAVCETIRAQNIEVPILFLSAKGSAADRIEGLRKGGDDYLTKPFNLEELLLRVEKLVAKNKRMQQSNSVGQLYEFAGGKIDFGAYECYDRHGKKQELSKKESALLKLLIERDGETVSREHILQVVWGYNVYPTTRTIDNFILSFRKHFEKDTKHPIYFHSIRGVGYKFTSKEKK